MAPLAPAQANSKGTGVISAGQIDSRPLWVLPMHQHRNATMLSRIHASMLMQSGGRASALRALITSETQRGPDLLRLANALSALYPKDSDEKRLLDAMPLAVPR